jgi:hypothetical protein
MIGIAILTKQLETLKNNVNPAAGMKEGKLCL